MVWNCSIIAVALVFGISGKSKAFGNESKTIGKKAERKLKAFLLLGLICVILAGCSNVFAKKDYYDTNKIAAVEDRYAKKNSASNSNNSGYSLH